MQSDFSPSALNALNASTDPVELNPELFFFFFNSCLFYMIYLVLLLEFHWLESLVYSPDFLYLHLLALGIPGPHKPHK